MIFVLNTNKKRKDAKVVKTKRALVTKKRSVIYLQEHFIVTSPLKNTNFHALRSKQNFQKNEKRPVSKSQMCFISILLPDPPRTMKKMGNVFHLI